MKKTHHGTQCRRAALLLLATLWHCPSHAHPLEGSWQLLSGEVNEQGQQLDYANAQMQGVKIISGQQFSFISHKDGKFYAAAAGSIQVEGQNYSETPKYASYPPMIGETYRFSFKLEGDLWHNERYQDGKLVERETWRRLPKTKLE